MAGAADTVASPVSQSETPSLTNTDGNGDSGRVAELAADFRSELTNAQSAAQEANNQVARDKRAAELIATHRSAPGSPVVFTDHGGIAKELNGVSDQTAREELIKATLNQLNPSEQAILKKELGLPDTYNKPWGAAFMENTAVGRIGARAWEGLNEGFGQRAWFMHTPEQIQRARESGLYNDYSREWTATDYALSIPRSTLELVNETSAAALEVGIATPLRTLNGVIYSGANTIGQIHDELGGTTGSSLARDLKALPEAFAGAGNLQTGGNRLATAARSGQAAEDARIAARIAERNVGEALNNARQYELRIEGIGSNGGNIRITKGATKADEGAKIAGATGPTAQEVENYSWLFKTVENDVPDLNNPGVLNYLREHTIFVGKDGAIVTSSDNVSGAVFGVPYKGEKLLDAGFAPSYPDAFQRFGPQYYIHSLARQNDPTLKGFGQVVMDKAIAAADKAGYKVMSLEVFEDNIGARRLYEKNGFEYKQELIEPETGRRYYYMVRESNGN